MTTERDTEEIIESYYRAARTDGSIVLERQRSAISALKSLFTSKKGTGALGKPEFIVTAPAFPTWVLVVEVKKDTFRHISTPDVGGLLSGSVHSDAENYAVDGVLHYMADAAPGFNVIGVALSGSDTRHKISVFRQLKGESHAEELIDRATEAPVAALMDFDSYLEFSDDAKAAARLMSTEALRRFAKKLHEDCRNHFSLTEAQKPLFVSACLLALQDATFNVAYKSTLAAELASGALTDDDFIAKLFTAIDDVLTKARIDPIKRAQMLDEFRFIQNNVELKKRNLKSAKLYLVETLLELDDKVIPFLKQDVSFDLVGMFYGEFIKYTGGDGKGLGIVLTPKHVTELMCKLISVDSNSIVLDTCTGTAGFLIAAMRIMIEDASRRHLSKKARDLCIQQIKKNQLIGIETKGFLYTMAAANMILRGDGKANLHHGSCFDTAILSKVKTKRAQALDFSDAEIVRKYLTLNDEQADAVKGLVTDKSLRPNRCLINPPYSQEKSKDSGDNLHELVFIKTALDVLVPGGKLACIVPLRVAFGSKKLDIERREEILKHHQLDAVLSMPAQLFHPVGTHTCIMVFTSHVQHDVETWFAYCKDDGFALDRVQGRADLKGQWPAVLSDWVSSFKNSDVREYFSVKRRVSGSDEWCAESYIATDFTKFTADSLESFVTQYQLAMLNVKLKNV